MMAHERTDPALLRLAARGVNQRQTGRLPQESLACSLGPVLDFSAGGMRVKTRRVPKGRFEVELFGLGGRITVPAEVIWTKRCGLFSRIVGVRFVNLDPGMLVTLKRMSSENRSRRLLASEVKKAA